MALTHCWSSTPSGARYLAQTVIGRMQFIEDGTDGLGHSQILARPSVQALDGAQIVHSRHTFQPERRRAILPLVIGTSLGGRVSTEIVKKYRHIWGENPRILLRRHKYQKELTKKLDAISAGQLDMNAFYEIVLWKLNRFPKLDGTLLKQLRSVHKIKSKDYKCVEPVLRKMLQCPGIALPMASTVLRFLNPHSFQIIDDRVYRIVRPGKAKYPNKPPKPNATYLDTSVRIYFEYLTDLRELCCDELPFPKSDRILYQLDIELGNRIGADAQVDI